MTDVHDVVAKVEGSSEFQSFKAEYPKAYLVHAFATGDATRAGPIELGYYNKETDKIIVFKSEPLHATPPEDMLKEHGHPEALELDLVKIGVNDAIERAKTYHYRTYSRHQVLKAIAILQEHEHLAIWNITFVTNTMNMVNLKMNALTGDVVSRSMNSIMDFAQ